MKGVMDSRMRKNGLDYGMKRMAKKGVMDPRMRKKGLDYGMKRMTKKGADDATDC